MTVLAALPFKEVAMKNVLWRVLIICLGLVAGTADAQPTEQAAQSITPAGSAPSVIGPAEYFTGRVRVDMLSPANASINAASAYVTFEPGARSAWHTHPQGQYLIVTAGAGLTQEWGKPVQQLRPGDVVWCPPGIKHWHGAAPTTALTHLAITGSLNGKNVQWLEKVSDEQEALSPKQQAIGPIAAFTATGNMARLHTALDQGLDAGLTVSDCTEILVQLYAYAGFPRSLNALTEFMRVLEERKQHGITDQRGSSPGPVPVGDELLALGTANQTKLVGAPVKGPLFDFAPAIDQYLKAHLFGDIFGRNNLDWQSRELATVAALAAMTGVEAQLQSHIRVSLNVGVGQQQLRQFIQILAVQVDADAAHRAQTALEKQLSTVPH
jgi:quercetin dioxygenase-like cupin family protein